MVEILKMVREEEHTKTYALYKKCLIYIKITICKPIIAQKTYRKKTERKMVTKKYYLSGIGVEDWRREAIIRI